MIAATERVIERKARPYIQQINPDTVNLQTNQVQPEIQMHSVQVSGESLKENMLMFIVIVLGLIVKPCHARWVQFQQGKKKSLVLAPRDHGKSTILTIAYIIFRIIKNPNIRILIVSNSAGMAENMLSAIKSHFEKNTILRALYSDFKGELWNNSAMTVSQRTTVGLKEPTVSTVGVFGSLVSGHYDLIICEDLVDFENSRTQSQRDKLWQWLCMVVLPTLETNELYSELDGEIHFRGTRYHYDDLYGRLIGEVEQYNPPMLNADMWIRDKALLDDGTSLWAERKSVERLLQLKRDVGSVIFNLQYQNDANMTKGRVYLPQYFHNTYKELPPDVVLTAGYDLAVSMNTDNDYFAEAVIGVDKQKNIYLIDIWRDRMIAPKQYETIQKSYLRHKWARCGVESVAYQEALAQWLRANTDVPVKSIKRSKDKLMRAYKIQPHFENGKFFMPEGRPFYEFVDEMIVFPDGDHDDLQDALETAITTAMGGSSFEFFFD